MAPSHFLTPSLVLNIALIFKTFLFLLTFFRLCNTTIKNIVEPNDRHISDLLVFYYDCSKQNNLRQFSLTRVQTCEQAPSSLEFTRVVANVYVRAKTKRLKAWTCEAYTKRERFVCAQSDYKYRRHDHADYHKNTMERPLPLDPTECKLAIRHLNGNNNPQFNSYNYNNSFTFFDEIKKQQRLERYQLRFQITRLNTYHFCTFAYVHNSDLFLNMKYGPTNIWKDKQEYINEKDSWSVIVREVELTYDENENTLKYNIPHTPLLI